MLAVLLLPLRTVMQTTHEALDEVAVQVKHAVVTSRALVDDTIQNILDSKLL
jgi:hypothetical protein